MEPWFKFVIVAAVFLLVFCQGLQTSLKDLKFFREHLALLIRSLASVFLFVPIAAYLIILAFDPSRPVAIAIGLFAACPAGPMILVRTSGISAKQEYPASLHIVVSVLSIITVPLMVSSFAYVLNFKADVGHLLVAGFVAKLVVVPLMLGVTLKRLSPKGAEKTRAIIEPMAKLAIICALVFLLSKTYKFLAHLDFHSYLSVGVVVALSLAIGHWAAGNIPAQYKTVLALESAGRHPGIVLLIVALNAPNAKAIPIVIPYLCVFLVLSSLYVSRRRLFPRFFSERPIARAVSK